METVIANTIVAKSNGNNNKRFIKCSGKDKGIQLIKEKTLDFKSNKRSIPKSFPTPYKT